MQRNPESDLQRTVVNKRGLRPGMIWFHRSFQYLLAFVVNPKHIDSMIRHIGNIQVNRYIPTMTVWNVGWYNVDAIFTSLGVDPKQ